MAQRTENLQRFIDAAAAAIQAKSGEHPDAMALATRIFLALKDSGAENSDNQPGRLEPCRHLDNAFTQARNGPPEIAELTDAFAAIEPEFYWVRRLGAADASDDFFNGHANAIIVGRAGLEVRQDALIGVSLVAPNIAYPRHHHPPEELYIVLSPGKWMQNDAPLMAKSSGDLVHNPSNTWHAMQATDVPLLAVWCLWTGA